MIRAAPQSAHSLKQRSFAVMGRPRGQRRGRPRRFVPAQALRQALGGFWDKGYQASSLDNLTAAMHLSQSSFYACFGSKHAAMMASVGPHVLMSPQTLLPTAPPIFLHARRARLRWSAHRVVPTWRSEWSSKWSSKWELKMALAEPQRVSAPWHPHHPTTVAG